MSAALIKLIGTETDVARAVLAAVGLELGLLTKAIRVDINLPERTGIRAGDFLLVELRAAFRGETVLEMAGGSWFVRVHEPPAGDTDVRLVLRGLVRGYAGKR